MAVNELLDQSLRCNLKNPQYAYIAPTYGAAKRIAWDILKDYAKNIPGVTFNEADLRLEIPRPAHGDKIKIILLGAENPGSIRGIYLDGVVLDEFAECDPTIWSQVVRPALSDRLGWAIFIGTPKGRNHFYDILNAAKDLKDWYTAIYKASQTGVIPQSELEAAKQTMSEDEYAQEYECDFAAALVGAYYGKEMAEARQSNRISRVPVEPSSPVNTAWDLGIDDSTAIWFWQRLGKEVRIVDYLEVSGDGLTDIVKALRVKGYDYGKHILPHDVQVRELGTGVSRLETLKKLGLGKIEVAPKLSIEDGINASRVLIKKSWFDKEKCERGISALENYERKWDAKNKIFTSKPLHNWASHGADAWRMLAVAIQDHRPEQQEIAKVKRTCQSDYDPLA